MARQMEQPSGFNPNSAFATSDALKASQAMPAKNAKTPQSQDHTVGKVVIVTASVAAIGAVACGEVSTIVQVGQTPGTGPDTGGGPASTPEPTATPDTRAETLSNIQYIAQLYQKDPTFKENDPYGWADPFRQLLQAGESKQIEYTIANPPSEPQFMNMGVAAVIVGYVDNQPVVGFFNNNQLYFGVLDYGGSVKVVDSNSWDINNNGGSINPPTTINTADLAAKYSTKTIIRFGLTGMASPANEQKIIQSYPQYKNHLPADDQYMFWLTNQGVTQPSGIYSANNLGDLLATDTFTSTNTIPSISIANYNGYN